MSRSTITRALLGTLTIAAMAVAAYALGYQDGAATPVDVRVVYEESGEPYELAVLRGDEPLRIEHVNEKWRGNDDAADGLYDTDPLEG